MKRFELIPSDEWFDYDLKITLKPCYRCNQCCWYCPEYDNKSNMWTLQQCNQVIETLQDIPEDKENVFIYFYGGEPTLSKYWEYLHFELSSRLADRNIFFQTQTNMSINKTRLEDFLKSFREKTPENHNIDICNSYHLGKQSVDSYIEKMTVCDKYDSLGLCFFSTEIPKEEQFIREFTSIADIFPDRLKLKFTVLPQLKLRYKHTYGHLFNDEYLMGTDNGEYIEYRYFMRKYPYLEEYLEESWNFNVDGVEKNYVDVINEKIYTKFKYTRCTAGSKGIVIDHNQKVYHCNDDFENNINITPLAEVDMSTYLSRDSICLNCQCWDGLDFVKYK